MNDRLRRFFYPIWGPIRFIQYHFKATLLVVIILSVMSSGDTNQRLSSPNLYTLHIKGPILESELFLQEVRKASDASIKGVLVVVDSPGGAVSPSVEMSMAIKRLAEEKPVVVYGAGTVASGSYYASIWADHIMVNPASMVGSIGVIFQSVNVGEAMKTLGLKPQIVKSGKYKEVGAPYREWEKYEKEALQRLSDNTYQMFVEDVAKARKLDADKHTSFANGKVFLATKALDKGLIDSVGSRFDAEDRLKELSGVSEAIWNKKDPVEAWIERMSQEASSALRSAMTPIRL